MLALAAACNPTPITNGDGGTDAGMMPSTCPTPSGAGTMHGSVMTDQTWTAATSPHVFMGDANILATLTLEACAVVQIPAKGTITVGTNGKIVAQGMDGKPVTITSKDAAAWSSIRAINGTLDLSYTIVEKGGDPLNTLPELATMLDIRGPDQTKLSEVFRVQHVVVRNSMTTGIFAREGGGFSADSTDLTIQGAAAYPMHIWSNLAGTIPPGTYTGNGVDQILLTANSGYEAITAWDVTFHDRGVPYHVGHTTSSGQLRVGGATTFVATLTIEPHVTLAFRKGAVMQIEASQGTNPASGVLVAKGGDDAHRITFTSAEAAPAPGDWLGIWFGQTPDARDALDHVVVEFAGGTSVSGSGSCPYTNVVGMPNDAAIRVFGVPASNASFVTNSIVSDSAAHGIDRGFRDDTKIDFMATNTFTNVAKCKQTYPKDANGACPMSPPCP
jgi:hypothetical protein